MGPIDFVIIGIIAVILGGALFYVIRTKKRGQKCIGCPDSKKCSGNCSSCHSCSNKCNK